MLKKSDLTFFTVGITVEVTLRNYAAEKSPPADFSVGGSMPSFFDYAVGLPSRPSVGTERGYLIRFSNMRMGQGSHGGCPDGVGSDFSVVPVCF